MPRTCSEVLPAAPTALRSPKALTPPLQTPHLAISHSKQELFLCPQPTQHPGTSSKPVKLEEVPLPIQSFLLP